jgi:hypothetical protein
MKKIAFGFIVIIVCCMACSKSSTSNSTGTTYTNPYASYPSLILGTWQWRWFFVYDSVYNVDSIPYENLVQHTGGTLTFTADSFYSVKIDTSYALAPGVGIDTLLDTTLNSSSYRIIEDSLISTENNANDTFIITVDATELNLILLLHSAGRFTEIQQYGHR